MEKIIEHSEKQRSDIEEMLTWIGKTSGYDILGLRISKLLHDQHLNTLCVLEILKMQKGLKHMDTIMYKSINNKGRLNALVMRVNTVEIVNVIKSIEKFNKLPWWKRMFKKIEVK